MANELMQAAGATLRPWTDYGLRTLETMVSWQQQVLEQWFRVLSAWSPTGSRPAARVELLQAPRAGGTEAAASSPRPHTVHAAHAAAAAKPRRATAARERPQAADTPRRGSAKRGKTSSRRR